MKEYIEREQAIALFYPVDPENDGSDGCTIVYKSGNFSSSEIEAMLSDLPAADVAEVVRCQDCKYRIYKDMGDDIGMIGGCQVWGVALPGDFYCAHGAHVDKEDEHEAG